MENKKKRYKKGCFSFGKLFLAGFLAGCLLPNLIWKLEWHQKAVASVYLLTAFSGRMSEGLDYFWQICRMRGGIFFLTALCGVSVFGVPAAVAELLLTGLGLGMLLTVSVLQFGLPGGAIGAALLFPQYLFYIPGLFYLTYHVYTQSAGLWRNQGLFPGGTSLRHMARGFMALSIRERLCKMPAAASA